MGEKPEPKKRKPLPSGPFSFVPKTSQIDLDALNPKLKQKHLEEQARRTALEKMSAEQRRWEGIDKLGWLYDLVSPRKLSRQNRGWNYQKQLYSAMTLGTKDSEIFVQLVAHELPTQHERWIEFRIKHPKRYPTDDEIEEAWRAFFPKTDPTKFPEWAMPLPENCRAFYLRVS